MNRNILSSPWREDLVPSLKSRLQMVSWQLVTAQEEERKRIAREIHDGLGQMLAAIKFKLESNFNHKEGDHIEREKQLGALLLMIQECIEESRRVQMDLRPPILDDLGIIPTISWFVRQFEATYSTIHITKKIQIEEYDVPTPIKTVIFRVMQEAFNNISKYSQASLVSLSLRRIGNQIELSISDNGIGFDLKKFLSIGGVRKGYGLSNMRERAELSGGSFAIESSIGKGTTIRMGWLLEEGS
jgi:signal transduction histidine kinase